MSIKFGAVILGAASLLFACETKADFLEFKLDQTFNGTSPSSTAPWLTATFTQGANGTVNLALQSSLSANSEFFGSLGFNIKPGTFVTGFTQTDGPPVLNTDEGQDSQDLLGGGNAGKGFDIMINFQVANIGSRFQGTSLINFIFSGNSPLTPADFDFFNASGLQIAAHVQGIHDDDSGAITGARTGETTVPDGGSTLILLGIGTSLIAFVRRAIIC